VVEGGRQICFAKETCVLRHWVVPLKGSDKWPRGGGVNRSFSEINKLHRTVRPRSLRARARSLRGHGTSGLMSGASGKQSYKSIYYGI
jgi:hypothetical protein